MQLGDSRRVLREDKDEIDWIGTPFGMVHYFFDCAGLRSVFRGPFENGL